MGVEPINRRKVINPLQKLLSQPPQSKRGERGANSLRKVIYYKATNKSKK